MEAVRLIRTAPLSLPGSRGDYRLVGLIKAILAPAEGGAVTGGPEQTLWCDLRVAASSAVFGAVLSALRCLRQHKERLIN
jgi:hypothetical protein